LILITNDKYFCDNYQIHHKNAMASESVAAIKLMMTYISNKDPDKLLSVLDIVPINNLSVGETNELLKLLLTHCKNFNSYACGKLLIEQWKLRVTAETVNLPGVEARTPNVIAFEHLMFLESLYWGDDILEFLVTALKITFFELMKDIIEYKYSTETSIACDAAFRLTYVDYATLIELRDIMDSYSSQLDYNFQVYDCIAVKIMELAPLAKKPDWLEPQVSESERDTLPTVSELHEEVEFILTKGIETASKDLSPDDLREVIDYVTENTKSQLIELKEAEGEDAVRDIIAKRIYELNDGQLNQLISDIVEIQTADSLYTNGRLLQIQGPDNSGGSAEPDESISGGYRMFPCNIFDYDSEDEEEFDWFDPYNLGHGNCMKCMNRIRFRWWSVRIPTPRGGWKGSYCSWECAINAARELYDAEPLFVVVLKIMVIARNLDALKIQDRRPDPEPEPEPEPEPPVVGFNFFTAFNP